MTCFLVVIFNPILDTMNSNNPRACVISSEKKLYRLHNLRYGTFNFYLHTRIAIPLHVRPYKTILHEALLHDTVRIGLMYTVFGQT